MSKENLIKLLTALDDDAEIKANFSYNNMYSSVKAAIIKSINLVIGKDNKISVVLSIDEINANEVAFDDVPF